MWIEHEHTVVDAVDPGKGVGSCAKEVSAG